MLIRVSSLSFAGFYHLLLASHFDLNQVTVLAASALNAKLLKLVLILGPGSVEVNLDTTVPAAERTEDGPALVVKRCGESGASYIT
jgi:hypothetical protein